MRILGAKYQRETWANCKMKPYWMHGPKFQSDHDSRNALFTLNWITWTDTKHFHFWETSNTTTFLRQRRKQACNQNAMITATKIISFELCMLYKRTSKLKNEICMKDMNERNSLSGALKITHVDFTMAPLHHWHERTFLKMPYQSTRFFSGSQLHFGQL